MKKLFHLGDILTLHTGYGVCVPERMGNPEGADKSRYYGTFDGLAEVVGFLVGQNLVNPNNERLHDARGIHEYAADAHNSLVAQCPWLNSVVFPKKDFESISGEAERVLFCQDWCRATIQSLGRGEWVSIEYRDEQAQVHAPHDRYIPRRRFN